MDIRFRPWSFFVIIFFLTGYCAAKAQDPCMDFSWANSFNARSATIDADDAGNVYVTGLFRDTLIMGKDTLYGPPASSHVKHHSFVARISPEGRYLWAVAITGTGRVHSAAVKVGHTGEIYIAGSFNETAFFGTDTLSSAQTNYHDLFLSTLSADGDFISTVTNNIYNADGIPIIASDVIVAGISPLTIDGSGNLYLAGSFNGTANFDGITLTSSTSNLDDLLFAKLNRSGQWAWAIAPQSLGASGTSAGMGHTITTDEAGNVYVLGKTRNNVVFGDDTLAGDAGAARAPFYLAKISPDGQWQWATAPGRAYMNTETYAQAVSVSPATGNIFISGDYSTHLSAVFGDDTLTSGAFFACTDPGGQLLWAHQPRTEGYNNVLGTYYALAATPGNGCYAASYKAIYHVSETGVFTDSFLVDTNIVFRSWQANHFEHPLLAADAGGRVYATGLFYGPSATFGNIRAEAAATTGSAFVTEISCDPPAGVYERREHPARYSVFPNPTTGMLMIDLGYPADAVMEVYDLHGRRLAVHEITGQQFAAMKLDGPSGIYLLQITTASGRVTQKIIRQ